jgi:hypothetical protein
MRKLAESVKITTKYGNTSRFAASMSPDLTPCDLFMGLCEDYRMKTHAKELNERIQREILFVPRKELLSEFLYVVLSVGVQGHHFKDQGCKFVFLE